jgi:N-methylhydantoinase A
MAGLTENATGTLSIGVDVGGTFTDAVMIGASGVLWSVKVPTTREDHGVGVIDAIARLLTASGTSATDVGRVAHGMTVGTNALLEGQLSPTALVATDGFGDILELRRQNRADLYRLDVAHPEPVVPRSRVVEARERCGPDGVILDLSPAEGVRIAESVRDLEIEAVAVALLFSFRYPGHERRIADAIRALVPGVHVSISSEVLGEIREYERTATTAVDAALTPVLRRYLSGLTARTAAAGLPAPDVMQSNGGLIDIDLASRHASRTVLSGPAAGVIGAALWARTEHIPHALTFDMGGTSCDVALIAHGEPGRTSGTQINGHPLHLPMLDIQTVSAGGGSIAWADSGGALRVGPRSAGARPGPAAYGFGGDQPTVTDAHVVLGRVFSVGTSGVEIPLERDRAVAAVGRLADALGLEAEVCAAGILAVANNEMARALRVVSVERGIDPRGLALVAFGGAGPLHACALAEELGMERVLVPLASGVLSALGLAAADLRRDYVGGTFEELEARASAGLPGAAVARVVDARYPGQSHELTIPEDADFHAAHERRYGFRLDVEPQVVTRRVTAILPRERPSLPCQARLRPAGPRRAWLDGEWLELPVLGPGEAVTGPAIVELPGSTCLVRPGWSGEPDGNGTLELTWTR